jgi:hypothetical protein
MVPMVMDRLGESPFIPSIYMAMVLCEGVTCNAPNYHASRGNSPFRPVGKYCMDLFTRYQNGKLIIKT